MIGKITSPNNPLIQELNKLKQKKHRNLNKQFLIEGYHLIEEARLSCNLLKVLTSKEEDLRLYEDALLVSDAVIKKLSSSLVPQGIIGLAMTPSIKEEHYHKYLLIDDIADPGNLGTIIRTMSALGVDALILSEQTVDCFNDKVVRASQGALFKIPLFTGDLNEWIEKLKKRNIPIYGTSLIGGIEPAKLIKTDSFALIIGNESRGVKDDLLLQVDQVLMIPMQSGIESLNVSIASALIVYELMRK